MAALGIVPWNDPERLHAHKGVPRPVLGVPSHLQLAIPAILLFTIHFAIRLRFVLLRWKIKEGPLVNLISLLVGVALFVPFLYLDLFFRLG